MSKIDHLAGREILDSRGEPTLEVELFMSYGRRVAVSVPQGKSTGSREAKYAPVQQAIEHIERIVAPALKEHNPESQREIDEILLGLDGTKEKTKLGANAILGVSLACARAGAMSRGIPLWRHIGNLREHEEGSFSFPRLYVNVMNGGLHAGNNLSFQEYLVIPKSIRPVEAIGTARKVFRALRETLIAEKGSGAIGVGDEGGFSPMCADDFEPFRLIQKAAEKAGCAGDIDVGIDAAAQNAPYNETELFAIYEDLIRTFHPLYIEDPFGEDDFKNFAALREAAGPETLIAGDDLTVTNAGRMEQAFEEGSVNAVIIKPNQVGTVSETLDAVAYAKNRGWSVIVSHRSGETNDDLIADLAVGAAADGFKLGAPARGERIAKYNRLLAIEKELK